MLCLHLVACLALSSGQKEDLPKTAVAVHAIRLLSEEAAQETMGSWSLEAVQLLVDSDCSQPLEFFNSHSTSLGPQYTVSSSGERCPANPFGAGCFFQGPGGLAGVFNQQPGAMFNYIWQGMPDANDSTGNIWIAVEFEIAKTIGCVKVAQQDEKFSNAIKVQVKTNTSSAWKTLCTVAVNKPCPLELLATCCESMQNWQCEWVLAMRLTDSTETPGTPQPVEPAIQPPSISQLRGQPKPSLPHPLLSPGWVVGNAPAHPGFEVSIYHPQPSTLSLAPLYLQPFPATSHTSPGPPMLPPTAAIPLYPVALAGGPSNPLPASPKAVVPSPPASHSINSPSMVDSGPLAIGTSAVRKTPTLLFNLVFSGNVPSSHEIPRARLLREVIMESLQGALQVDIVFESPRDVQVRAQFISPATAQASILTVSSFQFLLELQKAAGRKVNVDAIRTIQCDECAASLMGPVPSGTQPKPTPPGVASVTGNDPQPDGEEQMEKTWPFIGRQKLMIISVVSFVVSCFFAYGSAAAMLYSREGRNSNVGQPDLDVRADGTAADAYAHGEIDSPEPLRPGYATQRGRIASQEFMGTAVEMMSHSEIHTNQGIELESVLLPSTSAEAACSDGLTTASEIELSGGHGGGCLPQAMETERF